MTSDASQEKMGVMKTDSLFTILGVIACLGMPEWGSSQQVDITALVKARNPTFEREVQKICEESCLGNERKGWLHAVSYRKMTIRAIELKGGRHDPHRLHEIVHGNPLEHLDVFEDLFRQKRFLW